MASLADDSSPPGSQLSAVELVAMEEPDSILSQTTPVESQDAEKEEEQEILEMSQQIWEGENKWVNVTLHLQINFITKAEE